MSADFAKRFLKGVVSLLDPERESRLEKNATILHQEVAKAGRNFSLVTSPLTQRITGPELQEVKERVFRRVLTKAWEDEVVSPQELKTLQWLGEALQLPSAVVARIHGQFAKSRFERVFVDALEDGSITDAEYARLDGIAKSVHSSVPLLFRAYCSESADSMFRELFAAIIRDGEITEFEWQRLWKTAEQLGVGREELLKCLQPQAQVFVEQVLADAKADEVYTPEEDKLLSWLLNAFVLPAEFVAYVRSEIQVLQTLANAANGILPSLMNNTTVELRAGEILHHIEESIFRQTKVLKSGPRVESFRGTSLVTDSRFVFCSAEKTFTVNLRNIVGCLPTAFGVELRSSGKGAGEYLFRWNPAVATAILRTAVGRANQTIVQKVTELPGRHIARSVRQRVWQAYGGRCADCKSDQYLEYDHIIPVAKGGSNDEKNVQLLCRKCNLVKSDRI